MKRLIPLLVLLLPGAAEAIRVHATSCAALSCTTARNGEMCYELSTDNVYICDGPDSTWRDIGTGGGGGGGGGAGLNASQFRHVFTTESAGDIVMFGRAGSGQVLDALNCVASGGTTPIAQVASLQECSSDGASCVSSEGTITASAVDTDYESLTFADNFINDDDWWGVQLTSFTAAADYLECSAEFSAVAPVTACRHTFTTESASDVIMCGKADGSLVLGTLNCVANGSAPTAQVVTVVECDANGASCAGSGGTITAAASDTDYEDPTFTDNSIDDNDWWGLQMTSFTAQADYLNCQVEFYQPTTTKTCYHTFTSESAGDIVMCGEAKGTLTLTSLNCTATGGAPTSQVVTVVECTAGGDTCVGSGGTITAAASETNYEDTTFTDATIDDNDQWGLELTSYTTRADYLHCQVEFTST